MIEKTEEERNQIEITEETQLLYNKILKHEDEENNKLVQVKGYLPKDTELKVVEVPLEQLTEVFGEAKLDVAYDITLIMQVTKLVPVDENNPESEMQEVTETIEINPEDYSEKCEVSITDTKILENSQVYHVKDDNTYEQVTVTENSEDNITFKATTFSTYVVSSDESLMTASEESASTETNQDDEAGLDTSEQAVVNFTPYTVANTSQTSINVQAEVVGKQLNIIEYRLSSYKNEQEWAAVENPGTTFEIDIDLTDTDWNEGVYLHVKLEDGSIFKTGLFLHVEDTENTDTQAPVGEFVPETSTKWSEDPGVVLKFTDEGGGNVEHAEIRMQWSEIAQPGTDTTYKLVEANQPSADNNWQATIKPPQNVEEELYLRAKYWTYDYNGNADIRYIYTGPFKIDTKAPTISYTKTPDTEWTKSVTITASATDGGSGIKQIRFDNDSWKDAISGEKKHEKVVTENGEHIIYAQDWVNNEAKTTPILITNIDNKIPEIINVHQEQDSEGNIVLAVSAYDSQSGVKEYSFDGGNTWQTSNKKIVTAGETVNVVVKDGVGWISETKQITTVEKIEYNYTGKIQTYIVPITGKYKLEVYGAQGGSNSYYSGGLGGHSVGYQYFTKGTVLYIAVGEEGYESAETSFNGGGTAKFSINGTSGGGATSITTTNRGELVNFLSYTDEVLIVAGGGGGAGISDIGGNGQGGIANTSTIRFGQGESVANVDENGAGGGGWNGGLAGNNGLGGEGGTSYVGGVFDASGTSGTNEGNGKAVITFIFEDTLGPTVHFEPNGNTTWATTQSTTVTVQDILADEEIIPGVNYEGTSTSGLDERTLKYQWSTSATTEPTGLETDGTEFESGETIEKPNGTGTYYLWVTAQDNIGNTTVTHSEAFYVDNTLPTITVTVEEDENRENVEITVRQADVGGGLDTTRNTNESRNQYYLSTSDTSLVGGSWNNYSSGGKITVPVGTYYLYLKSIADIAGNISQANGTLTTIDGITYHRFGPYTVEAGAPKLTINAQEVPKNITGNILYLDALNNTGKGHQSDINTWTDLSTGTNVELINTSFTEDNYVSLTGEKCLSS